MPEGLADLAHLPGGNTALALVTGAARWAAHAWFRTPIHRWFIARGRPDGLIAAPRDLRPTDSIAGHRLLSGRFELAGTLLDTQGRGDPWDQPSPSARFATDLHRMNWLADLMSLGPPAHAEALRLILDWSRVFGRWNSFSWATDVLEYRVFNLACAVGVIAIEASEAERLLLGYDLARQARHLLMCTCGSWRASERLATVALAGTALGGEAGERLIDRSLVRLEGALAQSVHADGGHASRAPSDALDLLLLLKTLDQALGKRGIAGPANLMGAMDRLAGVLQFFVRQDGGLPLFQGGQAKMSTVAVACSILDESRSSATHRNGYHRLDGANLQVVVDAARPAQGLWSQTACAQPAALEVDAHGQRLIVGCGWSPDALGPQAFRMSDSASTLSIGDKGCGQPLRGWRARALGPRLVETCEAVEVRRHEADGGIWLELSHDAWGRHYHLKHERRLFLDLASDQLRGEDRLTPIGDTAAAADRRFIPFVIRFHVHPKVSVSLTRDGKSALLKPNAAEVGWRIRSDAQDISLEPSAYFQDGVAKRTQQVVLRGHARADAGAKVRWALARAKT